MPHGPWGEGMTECIAWMKRNRPKVRSPGAVCQTIAQKQGYKKADDVDDAYIDDAILWADAEETKLGPPSTVYLTAATSRDAWHKLAADGVHSMYIHRGFPAEAVIEHQSGATIHVGLDEGTNYAYDVDGVGEDLTYSERYMKMKELIPDGVKVVELHPVSSKSGYDKAMKTLGDTSPFIRAGDTIIRVTKHEPFTLEWCPDHENTDACPMRKALPTPEFPIECPIADTKRCGYVKSYYYEA